MRNLGHQSQWVYGIGNMYAYTTAAGFMISSEGPSPLGVRTFYANCTFLNLRDADWGQIDSYMNKWPEDRLRCRRLHYFTLLTSALFVTFHSYSTLLYSNTNSILTEC